MEQKVEAQSKKVGVMAIRFYNENGRDPLPSELLKINRTLPLVDVLNACFGIKTIDPTTRYRDLDPLRNNFARVKSAIVRDQRFRHLQGQDDPLHLYDEAMNFNADERVAMLENLSL